MNTDPVTWTALVFLAVVVLLTGSLVAVRRHKARGWWVCICGTRFHSNDLLDKHINECEAMK
ncbi:hypothetical protein ATK74_1788 [Propionicimonas paludicola]|uniref:Uncharacterized protein n=1 Tax=Propionicimonas paludicola TaxID=185243 RepID=A0A2A9CT46_9ACTN|nr:hypothetical protein [Propionicimonas paludicola]PFG17225.1 hypothetical protein ATK74_1788 [Propionicimonas paludicola]